MTQIDALLKYLRERKVRLGLQTGRSGRKAKPRIRLQLIKARPLTKISKLFACFDCEQLVSIGKRFASVKFGEIDLCRKCENRVFIENGFDSDVFHRVVPGGKSLRYERKIS